MKIVLKGKYKSLTSFESDSMPDFTVITGKNGSGKSQLIELAMISRNIILKSSPFQFEIIPKPNLIQINGMQLQEIKELNSIIIGQLIGSSYAWYQGLQGPLKEFIEKLLNNGLDFQNMTAETDLFDFLEGTEDQKHKEIRELGNITMNIPYYGGIGPHGDDYKITFTNKVFGFRKSMLHAKEVMEYKHKKFNELVKNDFSSTPIDESFYSTESAFDNAIENLFYGYARRRFLNEIQYLQKQNGAKNDSVSDPEFIKMHPEPWKIINEILQKNEIKLRVPEISNAEFSPEFDFAFVFTDISSGNTIEFQNLSSGEKIISALIIKLFITAGYSKNLQLPDCIFLDEPDAYLHPEMSLLLINVLYNTFVKDLNIKVIITTHSPSTVALAPEDAIFELKNGPASSLSNISKDAGLKILTENIPLLSIDYKNHRHIFLESPTDLTYYQTVFNKLKADQKTLHELYFITMSMGKSNCDTVIKLTIDLRSAGNTSAFGIIDWDAKNDPSKFIEVHGHKKRYSVENYILDPIYLIILFIEEGLSNNVSELGFSAAYNQYNLFDEPDERLTDCLTWFFAKFETTHPVYKYENLISIDYASGRRISVPSWFVEIKGHDLVIQLKAVFKSLERYRNEGELQKKLSTIMGKCYPSVPLDTYGLLIKLSHKKYD